MHHANVLIGSREWAYTQIAEADRTPGLDVSVRAYDRMSIVDVRALVRDANLKPIERTHRIFIVDALAIPTDAQNALLKLFEEPNTDTIFYVIIPSEGALLETLRSRLYLLGTERAEANMAAFTAFKRMGYAERLGLIAEKVKAEDAAWIRELVRGIEMHAHTVKDPALMGEVLELLSYIESPGSSKKMLLEHIALSL